MSVFSCYHNHKFSGSKQHIYESEVQMQLDSAGSLLDIFQGEIKVLGGLPYIMEALGGSPIPASLKLAAEVRTMRW